MTIWNPEATYSVDNAETENLKSEEDLNAKPESSDLTETQEDILKEEITYGGVNSLYAKLESKSTIMHDAQLDEVIGTDNEDQCSKTTETTKKYNTV